MLENETTPSPENSNISELAELDVNSVLPLEEIIVDNVEPEPTEEEKRQKLIDAIKKSHLRYKPKKLFGVAYKQERKRKNKAQRKSRKINRQ